MLCLVLHGHEQRSQAYDSLAMVLAMMPCNDHLQAHPMQKDVGIPQVAAEQNCCHLCRLDLNQIRTTTEESMLIQASSRQTTIDCQSCGGSITLCLDIP